MASARLWTLLLFMSVAAEAIHAQTCSDTDSAALLYFSREVPQSGTAFSTWIEGGNCCQWTGVTCNGAGRVIGLNITNADIPTVNPSGTPYVMCSGLGDLNSLEILSIVNVGLSGTLSTTLGGLVNLRTLIMDGCNLIGAIPDSYCNLNNLQTLILRNNLLDSYPSCFDTNPSTIDLTGNKFGNAPKRPAA